MIRDWKVHICSVGQQLETQESQRSRWLPKAIGEFPHARGSWTFSIQAFTWWDKLHLHNGGQSAHLNVTNLNVNLIQKHLPSWHTQLTITHYVLSSKKRAPERSLVSARDSSGAQLALIDRYPEWRGRGRHRDWTNVCKSAHAQCSWGTQHL